MSDNKMKNIYTGLWTAIAAIYGIWMSVFMSWDKYPYIIATDADMKLPAEEFVAKFDGMLFEPLYANETQYWLWVIFSTVLLCLTETSASLAPSIISMPSGSLMSNVRVT